MKYNYCYTCGQKTQRKTIEGKPRSFCNTCQLVLYDNPIPSVAIVAFNEPHELLLTRRSVEPGKGLWCLPGGFVEAGENILDTVKRELKEETNLNCKNIKIIGAKSVLNGYWGDILILGYSVELLSGEMMAGDDAEAVAFFPLDNRPKIVFPVHEDFLNKYLNTIE
jgi:ADP-ribose pyrophosphatase YjhB (NUDIX family)